MQSWFIKKHLFKLPGVGLFSSPCFGVGLFSPPCLGVGFSSGPEI